MQVDTVNRNSLDQPLHDGDPGDFQAFSGNVLIDGVDESTGNAIEARSSDSNSADTAAGIFPVYSPPDAESLDSLGAVEHAIVNLENIAFGGDYDLIDTRNGFDIIHAAIGHLRSAYVITRDQQHGLEEQLNDISLGVVARDRPEDQPNPGPDGTTSYLNNLQYTMNNLRLYANSLGEEGHTYSDFESRSRIAEQFINRTGVYDSNSHQFYYLDDDQRDQLNRELVAIRAAADGQNSSQASNSSGALPIAMGALITAASTAASTNMNDPELRR